MIFLLTDTLLHNDINIADNVVVKTIEAAPNGIRWDTILSALTFIITSFLAVVSLYRTEKDRKKTDRKIHIAAKQSILYQMQSVLNAMSKLYDATENDNRHQTDESATIKTSSFASFDKEATRLKLDVANISYLTEREREIVHKAVGIMDEFFYKIPNDLKSAIDCKLKFSYTITELKNAKAD